MKSKAFLVTTVILLLISASLLGVSYAGTSWSIQTVDSAAEGGGRYSSIALDSSGKPVISYYDASNGDLKVAFWNGVSWNAYTVDSTGDVGMFSSIALDSNDIPWISYYDDTYGDLKIAHWAAGYWATEIVDSGGDVGQYSDIALNSSGYPCISYYDASNDDGKFAYWDGSAWRTTVFTTFPVPGGELHGGLYTSLAFTSNGTLWISYYDPLRGLRYYYETDTGDFGVGPVDSDGDVGMFSSIALDSSDRPVISYYDNTNDRLKVAFRSGSSWNSYVVDSGGDVGQYSSIAMNSSDIPWISYYNVTGGDLKIAHWAGYWATETVDSAGDVGRYSSIALDSSGRPHISYYDVTNGALKYAYGQPAAPTCGVTINYGNAYAISSAVTLSLDYSASFATVTQVRYSNDGVWNTETWETPSATRSWVLSSGDGMKTVYFQVQDSDGMLSGTYSDTIILDTTAPTGSILINNGDAFWGSASVVLWLTYEDATSGVSQVRYSNDDIWDTETWEAPTAYKSWSLLSGDGMKTVYYQVKDNAGLSSAYSDTIVLDTSPPQGSIQINNGAAYTNGTGVGLALSAVDAVSGVSQMRFSEDGSAFSDWEPYSTSKSWSLQAGDGMKNVYVQYKNRVELIVTAYDSITLDMTLPVADAGQSQNVEVGQSVAFNGSGSSDNMGIASYTWNFGDGSTGTGAAPTHTYSSEGTYTVNLTVTDMAGNTAASSSTVSVTLVIPEFPSSASLVLFFMLASALALSFRERRTFGKQG